MARTGLTEVKENITITHRMTGAMLADMWSKSDQPPVGSDKAGYYAAALIAGASGEARRRIARCLVWSDFVANHFCLSRIEWYAEAVRGNPNDERCVFFAAALCSMKVIQDLNLTAFSYHCLLNPAWDRSPYWNRFALPHKGILAEVGKLYAAALDVITPDRVDIVERALERSEDRVAEKKPLAVYLARAYRQHGRTDETAEIVYRYVFTHESEDIENNAFLARLYLDRKQMDGDACAVFSRMVGQCDRQGNEAEADFWTLRLAQNYLAMGRVDEGTAAAFERAGHLAPHDQDIRAALLCAVSRRRMGRVDADTLQLLEEAVEDEMILAPRFNSRRWDWGLIIRALAHAYGAQNRTDEEAMKTYARATGISPEERELWGYYARCLAIRGDQSEKAMDVYEKAVRLGQADDAISVALARAYVRNNSYDGPRRSQALSLWETLYRQGIHWPEMVNALARAYTAEDRVNDIALSLWEKSIAEDDKNGPMRLRLAQEYRARSEFDIANRYYREAAKLMPKDFNAQYEAATLIIDHFSDYPTIIRLLQKAVKLPAGQKHLHAHFALAEALLFREKRDEARVLFQKIIDEIDANHTPTLLHLAKLSLKYEAESVKQAEALYAQAKNIDPDQPETYRRMADLYHEKGQYEEEEKALEKYLELSEPDADKYYQLAHLYIRRGDYLRAETALRQVITLGRGDKQLYTLLGEVILQGRTQKPAA